MKITTPAGDDEETVRDIAGRSMRASYSLSPEEITTVLEQAFASDRLQQRVDDDDKVMILAEDDGQPVGVAAGRLTDDVGVIEWLFVAPESRGQGVGTDLFEDASDRLRDQGADRIHAEVMSENKEGEQFFEQFGYERIDHEELEFDGQTYATHVYGPEASDVDDSLHLPDTIKTEDGQTLFTGDERFQATEAPFLALYSDEGRTDPYGFFCTHCGTMANAADGLDRVVCDSCGNENLPDEWDDSYL